ncbi:MAG TPA: radical SAM protein [Methanomicrobiales archaeon]|nr:radical SAM protein [Methanomicrobiales archaeon]
MRVLFLNPARSGQGTVPLNIPILISTLRRAGHEVRLFDFSDYALFDTTNRSYESRFFKEAPLDEQVILEERKRFYAQKFGEAVADTGLRGSDPAHDFEAEIKRFRPDIIAVTSLSVDFGYAVDFLRPFGEKYSLPVVFGGIHTILLPEEVMETGICDYICTGEGEHALPDLVGALDAGSPLADAKGIWYRKGGEIQRNDPVPLTVLATLPPPDFSDFDPVHFYRPFDGVRYKMINYELSRGCPFNCTYCVNGVLKERYRGLGRYHRRKGVDQSIGELKELIGRYRFDFIRFWDEDFTTVPVGYLEEYAERYREEIDLPFLIYARVDTVTGEKLDLLKAMGCRGVAMGIESGNERIRNQVLNRKMTNQLIVEKFRLVKAKGIRVSAYNMMGFPSETRETIFDTIELNRQADPDSFSVTILEPYRGTPIRKLCEAEGLDPSHETTWNVPQFIPKGMTFRELQGLHRTFPFYVRFPKDQWPEVRRAETDDGEYGRLMEEFRAAYIS